MQDGEQGKQGEEDKSKQGEQPQKGQMSKADAQRLLEALMEEENKTQEKVRKGKVKVGRSTIEKDW